MSFQDEQYYKIEAYLSGELDAEELKAFENEISTDDLLRAELEKHQVANALIVQQRLLSVKYILQEERIKDSNSGTSFKPLGFILLAVATIGIGASIWMLNKDEVATSTPQQQDPTSEIAPTVGVSKKSNSNESVKVAESIPQQSQQHNSTPDIGFHKHQIQQVEEQMRVDEKSVSYVDSTVIFKNNESNTPLSKTQTPTVKSTVPADPCSNVFIKATVRTSESCIHEATGNILVQNIQGGTKPYSIALSSTSNESVTNGALPKGTYQAIVSDATGCIHTYSNIVVTEKDCPKDYSFNPFMGEKWSIEAYRSAGQLEIYNKGGVLYYQMNLEALKEIEWSGMGIGNQIIPGYYIFVLKYADGTIKRGSVTIVQ